MNNVYLAKLITGEEVLFRSAQAIDLTEFVATAIKADHVLMLVVVPSQVTGQYGLRFVPYSAGDPEGSWIIPRSSIVALSTTVSDELVKNYLQQVSGIDLVTAVDALAALQ